MEFKHINAFNSQEAIELLNKYGEKARLIAGGTDLLIDIKNHAALPEVLINLKTILDLNDMEDRNQYLEIGALKTLKSIETDPLIRDRIPILAQAARSVASYQIRNLATIGGNLCQNIKCWYYNRGRVSLFLRESLTSCIQQGGMTCHASGSKHTLYYCLERLGQKCMAVCASDIAPVLASLEASVCAVGPSGTREIPVKNFISGPGDTVLDRNEILTTIKVPYPPSHVKGIYLKYSRNPIDFPIVSVAALVGTEQDSGKCYFLRVVLGGIAYKPIRLFEMEDQFKGNVISENLLFKAAEEVLVRFKVRTPETAFKLSKMKDLLITAITCASILS